jgi:hypothetical protein
MIKSAVHEAVILFHVTLAWWTCPTSRSGAALVADRSPSGRSHSAPAFYRCPELAKRIAHTVGTATGERVKLTRGSSETATRAGGPEGWRELLAQNGDLVYPESTVRDAIAVQIAWVGPCRPLSTTPSLGRVGPVPTPCCESSAAPIQSVREALAHPDRSYRATDGACASATVKPVARRAAQALTNVVNRLEATVITGGARWN